MRHTLVVTAAYTGMRWGELTGLQPHRCRLDDGVLLIDPDDGSLHEVGGRLFLGPPKNGRGRTIHPFLIDLLRQHLDQIDTPQVFTSHRRHLPAPLQLQPPRLAPRLRRRPPPPRP